MIDWRHWVAFLGAGLGATATDLVVFLCLHRGAGLEPYSARFVAICVALLVGWQLHRRFTFRVTAPASVRELGRYAAVAWVSILVNYAVFAAAVALLPSWPPSPFILVSSAVAMFVSYLGMRLGVFRRARG